MGACVALAGCSGEVETGGDGLTGTAIDTFDPGTGAPTTRALDPATVASISVEAGGGKYTGTLDANGGIRVPGVPEGPYELTLVSAPKDGKSVPVTSRFDLSTRTFDLGTPHSCRAGLAPLTQPSFFILNAGLTRPWQASFDPQGNATGHPDDLLLMYSRGTGTVGIGTISAAGVDGGGPLDGATEIAGWGLDVTAELSSYTEVGVPAFAGDDLAFLHGVSESLGDGSAPGSSPWSAYVATSVQEAFLRPSATLDDGGTSMFSGNFTAGAPLSFSLDYPGDAWNALLADVSHDPAAGFFLDLAVLHEAGAPDPMVGASVALVDVMTGPTLTYADPDCNPTTCADTCTNGCESAVVSSVLPGPLKHDFTFVDPLPGGQRLAVASLSFYTRVQALLPDTTSERLSGFIYVQAPADEVSGKPLAPVVGLPRAVTVGGKATPVDQMTSGVGTTTTIAFQPPSLGTPTSYLVAVVDVDDLTDSTGAVSRRRTVASVRTESTSVELPPGLLKTGRHYYARVSALVDDGDRAKPYHYSRHMAEARTYSGLFTP